MSPPNVYAPPVGGSGPLPGGPFACPHCDAPGRPDPRPQRCGRCGKRLTMVGGPAHDPSVVPPPFDPSRPTLGVRWSAVVAYKFGSLDAMGISEGMLDPVVGVQTIAHTGVAYPDVVSIAIWRKLDWVALVVAIVFAPVALGLLATAFARVWAVALLGLGLTIATAWLGYRAVGVGRCYARVVGRYGVVTIRFDQPARKRGAFHDELFRRTGIAPPPLP